MWGNSGGGVDGSISIRVIKAFLLVLASAIMGICLICLPESSGAVSITYVTVISIYLGLDIASMIAKTASLPKGQFKSLNVYKYAITSFCLVVLIIMGLFLRKKCDVNTAMTSFTSAVMIILGCLIGGLEGNKIATRNDGDEITSESIEEGSK